MVECSVARPWHSSSMSSTAQRTDLKTDGHMDRKLGLGGLGPLLEKTQPPPSQRRSLLNKLCLL